jgi:para-nitrobenzyl esterase
MADESNSPTNNLETGNWNRRSLLRASLLGGATLRKLFAGAAPAVATTRYGKVGGAAIKGVSVFRGIPYGGPTEGPRRFLPPVEPQKWTGVRDAIDTGPRCVQAPGNLFDSVIGDYFSGGRKDRLGLDQQTDSENCLVLNVLTPALGASNKAPVMVYIHGGGFTGGSGVIACAADDFPREQNVVLVSVNHRLNVFGYLYLGELSAKYSDSGNAGMLDLVLALEWVRDNIANFGGDPHNVTIFGESGGGGKVSALMAMPAAKGLFHKAIVESGSSLRASTKEDATGRAKATLKKLGLAENQSDELQNIPASKLFEAAGRTMGVGPVVDGRSIPGQTWDPNAPEFSAGVPMIIGTCKDESNWLVGNRDPSTFNLDEAGLRARVAKLPRLPNAGVDRVIELYRKARPHATPSDILFAIATEPTRINAIAQAERKTKQGHAPAYVYFFTYDTPILDGRFKAFHTAELPLVLRLVKYPESEQLSRQLSGAWAAFARQGNPNHRGIPNWPAYTLEQRTTMIFGAAGSSVENDPRREERLAWEDSPPVRRSAL